ncbi:MAG TPA: hypothetical protein VHP58_04050 [Alphaproteobacteria bacterium]|nr:hypothetical protein [Alphaproteobacteria bacterium]
MNSGNPMWLTQVEATLTMLENIDADDTTPAGFATVDIATRQLAQLTSQLGLLTEADRRSMTPRIAALQSRIADVLQQLGKVKSSATGQLQSLRHHGQALNAYLVSDNKK